MIPISNDQSGAILTVASSLTCILGSLVIYSDVIWRWFSPKTTFNLNNNEHFLVCSLSLSSGILLFTSLYKLLPQGYDYFKQSDVFADKPQRAHFVLIIMFFTGVVFCSVFNMVIHAVTSRSVVHCVHDGHVHNHDLEDEHEHSHDISESPDSHNHDSCGNEHTRSSLPSSEDTHVATSDSSTPQALYNAAEPSNENTPLLTNPSHKRQSLIDFTEWKLRRKRSIGKCMGYSSVSSCDDLSLDKCEDDLPNDVYDFRDPETGEHLHQHIDHINPRRHLHRSHSTQSNKSSTNIDLERDGASENIGNIGPDQQSLKGGHEEEGLHHHHVSTRYSHLFSIGAQTAFAISVHKVPEGILTFATSHANKELGFSVFLSLAIHNFSEGFTIAFPLFLALGSRGIAITAAIILGGLSQPFGAFLAWAFFHFSDGGNDNKTSPFIFGLIVSISAGFLCIIGLQMYGTAISFGGTQRLTMFCAFLGIAAIGTAYSLTAK